MVSYWLVENHNEAAAHSSGKPWDDLLGARIPPSLEKSCYCGRGQRLLCACVDWSYAARFIVCGRC